MNKDYIIYSAIASYCLYNLYKMSRKPVCRKCECDIDNLFKINSITLCYKCYTNVQPKWDYEIAKFVGDDIYFYNFFILNNYSENTI